jgi:hypothetical protein
MKRRKPLVSGITLPKEPKRGRPSKVQRFFSSRSGMGPCVCCLEEPGLVYDRYDHVLGARCAAGHPERF